MKVPIEDAESISLKALTFIAGDDELLQVFLEATGIDLVDLLARANDPLLLGGVLDFLMQSDSMVREFAESAGIEPESVMAARQALPGGKVGDQ